MCVCVCFSDFSNFFIFQIFQIFQIFLRILLNCFRHFQIFQKLSGFSDFSDFVKLLKKVRFFFPNISVFYRNFQFFLVFSQIPECRIFQFFFKKKSQFTIFHFLYFQFFFEISFRFFQIFSDFSKI